MGKLLGEGFDRILMFKDHANSDRADGELNALLRRGIESTRRVSEVRQLDKEQEAIAEVFRDLRPGDLVVIGVEAIEQGLRWVRSHLGTPVPLAHCNPVGGM